jgi:FkbH-like protein
MAVAAIKCLVWDLDNTIWDGILVEDGHVSLRPEVPPVLEALDARGILHSIASRNPRDVALAELDRLGIGGYFLYPQINWGTKSYSVETIARRLNLGLDALGFIDDQAHEREEVAFSLPDVRCFDADRVTALLDLPELMPRFVTEESKQRRQLYRSQIARDDAENEFSGPKEEFLKSLGLRFAIWPATMNDLKRAEELTVRTHQLNTPGRAYTYEELAEYAASDQHLLWMAELQDRFGDYGTIGLALVDCGSPAWKIRLLLMSCRVMSKGVGSVMLSRIMARAKARGVRLRAEFVENGRNRLMYVTYKLAGFREIARHGTCQILEVDLQRIPRVPGYVTLREEESNAG